MFGGRWRVAKTGHFRTHHVRMNDVYGRHITCLDRSKEWNSLQNDSILNYDISSSVENYSENQDRRIAPDVIRKAVKFDKIPNNQTIFY